MVSIERYNMNAEPNEYESYYVYARVEGHPRRDYIKLGRYKTHGGADRKALLSVGTLVSNKKLAARETVILLAQGPNHAYTTLKDFCTPGFQTPSNVIAVIRGGQ